MLLWYQLNNIYLLSGTKASILYNAPNAILVSFMS